MKSGAERSGLLLQGGAGVPECVKLIQDGTIVCSGTHKIETVLPTIKRTVSRAN